MDDVDTRMEYYQSNQSFQDHYQAKDLESINDILNHINVVGKNRNLKQQLSRLFLQKIKNERNNNINQNHKSQQNIKPIKENKQKLQSNDDTKVHLNPQQNASKVERQEINNVTAFLSYTKDKKQSGTGEINILVDKFDSVNNSIKQLDQTSPQIFNQKQSIILGESEKEKNNLSIQEENNQNYVNINNDNNLKNQNGVPFFVKQMIMNQENQRGSLEFSQSLKNKMQTLQIQNIENENNNNDNNNINQINEKQPDENKSLQIEILSEVEGDFQMKEGTNKNLKFNYPQSYFSQDKAINITAINQRQDQNKGFSSHDKIIEINMNNISQSQSDKFTKKNQNSFEDNLSSFQYTLSKEKQSMNALDDNTNNRLVCNISQNDFSNKNIQKNDKNQIEILPSSEIKNEIKNLKSSLAKTLYKKDIKVVPLQQQQYFNSVTPSTGQDLQSNLNDENTNIAELPQQIYLPKNKVPINYIEQNQQFQFEKEYQNNENYFENKQQQQQQQRQQSNDFDYSRQQEQQYTNSYNQSPLTSKKLISKKYNFKINNTNNDFSKKYNISTKVYKGEYEDSNKKQMLNIRIFLYYLDQVYAVILIEEIAHKEYINSLNKQIHEKDIMINQIIQTIKQNSSQSISYLISLHDQIGNIKQDNLIQNQLITQSTIEEPIKQTTLQSNQTISNEQGYITPSKKLINQTMYTSNEMIKLANNCKIILDEDKNNKKHIPIQFNIKSNEIKQINIQVEINQILKCYQLIQQKKNLQVKLDYLSQNTVITTNIYLFRQLIHNLVGNAFQHSQKKQTIKIDIQIINQLVKIAFKNTFDKNQSDNTILQINNKSYNNNSIFKENKQNQNNMTLNKHSFSVGDFNTTQQQYQRQNTIKKDNQKFGLFASQILAQQLGPFNQLYFQHRNYYYKVVCYLYQNINILSEQTNKNDFLSIYNTANEIKQKYQHNIDTMTSISDRDNSFKQNSNIQVVLREITKKN